MLSQLNKRKTIVEWSQYLPAAALKIEQSMVDELLSRTSGGRATMTQSLPLSSISKAAQILSGDTLLTISDANMVVTRIAVLKDTELIVDI